MSLTKETIDKIRDTADVVEVVGEYVTLKKKGQNYMACCPFHNEKTPSFSVSPAKGIFKCFGCSKAGDSIRFVMDIEGVGYLDALKILAKKYGIEVEETATDPIYSQQQQERESLYIVLNYAKNYFQELLQHHEEGKAIGLSYFQERGFRKEVLNKFELGYSLTEWEAFTKTALEKGYSLEVLEKSGLSILREKNDNNLSTHYDRFRGRVIFPIHNVAGRVIAFGARILKNEKNQPKYVNSPETDVYHKSKVLYGISQAKQAIRQKENCYLVEGYTDVISMHQAGVENVVASSGTSLTEEQIKLIGRYTPNITVLYDGDAAGIKASVRGIDLILEAGLNVSVVLFPDGDDPDSYIKKRGSQAFIDFLKTAQKDFITFKTELFLKEAGNDPVKKAEVIREIVGSISKIPDSIKRQVFLRQCSQLLAIDEQVLITESNKMLLTKAKSRDIEQPAKDLPTATNPIAPAAIESPATEALQQTNIVRDHEREIIRLLINYGDDALDADHQVKDYLFAETDDREFKTPLYQKMLDCIKVSHESNPSSGLLAHEDNEIRREAIDLVSSKYELSKNWERYQIFVATEKTNLTHAIFTTVTRLKWKDICEMIEDNRENLKHTENDIEEETFLKIHMKLKQAEKEVAAVLGNVVR